jgi:ABC-2 type transport system permease protein
MISGTLIRRVLIEHRRGIFGWTCGIVALVAIQIGVYPTIRSSASDWSALTDQFPDAIKEIFRLQDYASERGYLSAELLSFTVPFIVMGFGCTWGARVATEEEDMGTADIVLSLPLSRRDYIVSRIVAAVYSLLGIMTAFSVSVLIGTRLLGFSIPMSQYLSAFFSLFSIGLLMMAVAVCVGSLTGKRTMALGLSMALAIALFVVYSLAPLVSFLDATVAFNPMQWTIGSQPLFNGTSIGYSLAVFAVTLPLLYLSIVLFERRDIAG